MQGLWRHPPDRQGACPIGNFRGSKSAPSRRILFLRDVDYPGRHTSSLLHRRSGHYTGQSPHGWRVLVGVAPEYTDKNRDALLFGGLTLLGIGNILWRVLCEMGMLVFRIHEALMDLDDKARTLIGLLVKVSERKEFVLTRGESDSS